MKINLDNFYVSTKGKFKFIKEFDRNDIVFSSKNGIRLITNKELVYYVANAINCDLNELKVIFKSFSKFHHTGSFYIFKKNTNEIFRLSDHWSSCNNEKVNTCGWIRTCFWSLKTFKKDDKNIIGLKPKCKFYNYQLGKIQLNNFKKINYENNL